MRVVAYSIASLVAFMASGLSFHLLFYGVLTINSPTPHVDLLGMRLVLLGGGIALFACAVWLMAKAIDSYMDD